MRSLPFVRFSPVEDFIVNGKLLPVKTAIFPAAAAVHAVPIQPATAVNLMIWYNLARAGCCLLETDHIYVQTN